MPDSQEPLGGEAPLSSRFVFEVDGVEIGVFTAVQGLSVHSRTEDLHEGGQNGYTHKLPGPLEWPNIVFTHGLTQSDALFDWMNRTAGEGFAAAGNKLTRSTGAITAISNDGVRSRSWSLDGVFPVRWKGPDFDGTEESFLTEELEVTHHGFRASNVGG
ncbi:phage tail protein [Nakamurella lactea]|uniref:phage tail protein n=1 Tax=Nakamurella lactea TaxID=459515 RepID=UPI00040E8B56|nr:phage tail protein [Nakamurella lactea]